MEDELRLADRDQFNMLLELESMTGGRRLDLTSGVMNEKSPNQASKLEIKKLGPSYPLL